MKPYEKVGTPEWEADNLRRMMKIIGSEENIKEWSDFLVEQIKLFLIEEDDAIKRSKIEIIQVAFKIIELNINHIIEVYSLRQPLYRKYRMEPLEFEGYIKEYFYSYISELMEKVDFEVENQKIDLENVIKRFQNNLKKMAIFAGHSEGEVRFPTGDAQFVNLNDKVYQITIQVLDENIEAMKKIYKLLKKLYPEKCSAELLVFDQKVSEYLYDEINSNIKIGITDIEKKQRMLMMFESHKG